MSFAQHKVPVVFSLLYNNGMFTVIKLNYTFQILVIVSYLTLLIIILSNTYTCSANKSLVDFAFISLCLQKQWSHSSNCNAINTFFSHCFISHIVLFFFLNTNFSIIISKMLLPSSFQHSAGAPFLAFFQPSSSTPQTTFYFH